MPFPSITALPPAPQRTDLPAEFSNKADAFVAALQPFRNQLNTMAGWFETEANRVLAVENNAEQFALEAEGSANSSANSATTALGYRDETALIRNATITFRNQAEGFADAAADSALEAKGYRDQAEGFVIAGRAWVDTQTSISKTLDLFERCTVNTSGLTMTLPSTPLIGTEVQITVGNFANTVIDGNGNTIIGRSDTALINRSYSTVHLFFNGTEWRFA